MRKRGSYWLVGVLALGGCGDDGTAGAAGRPPAPASTPAPAATPAPSPTTPPVPAQDFALSWNTSKPRCGLVTFPAGSSDPGFFGSNVILDVGVKLARLDPARQVSVRFLLRNAGSKEETDVKWSAGRWPDGYREKNPANAVSLGTTLSTPNFREGTTVVTVTVDPDGDVPETNEANNVLRFTFTPKHEGLRRALKLSENTCTPLK